jgi:hypothetical protein
MLLGLDEKLGKLNTEVALPLGGGGGGGGGAVLVTVMANAGSDAEAVAVRAWIPMLPNVPTLEVDGVPESRPFAMLKAAQEGLLLTAKLIAWPLGSLTVGVNEYACPALTCVGGVPLMVGPDPDDPRVTLIRNAGSATETPLVRSYVDIVMVLDVPTFEADGVPESRPLAVLKAAQRGLFQMAKLPL